MCQIPRIHLLCMDEQFREAFDKAAGALHLSPAVIVTHHSSALSQLSSATQFDLVVSPANSYGRLDGGFDDAISRAFAPREDYHALTRNAQKILYEEWRGFAPPGTCTLVPIPDEFRGVSRNVWGTKYVALCPTMRAPQNVNWDREVVYECIWSLLCAIDKHNRSLNLEGKAAVAPITSLLMTPMGTGTGYVSAERWANQTVLALNHFVDSLENPTTWSSLGWKEIQAAVGETKETWGQ
ncbi:hypothetical protein HJFPF1_10044 [Paramyrothecium foliicola]|nr:hypothetical protein HJFPF1_10044 [Paramyrothecium foliicola]